MSGTADTLDEIAAVLASLPVGGVPTALPGLGREVADLFSRAASAIRTPPATPLTDAEQRASNALSALTPAQRAALGVAPPPAPDAEAAARDALAALSPEQRAAVERALAAG